VLFTWPDTLFWGILGALVIVNLLLEGRRPARAAAGAWRTALEPLKVAGTQWVDLVTWWKVG
jgi:hypothetical protein